MGVEALEAEIGTRLPEDYRRFLSDRTFEIDGTHWFQITERTPFGEQGGINQLFSLDDFSNDGIRGFPDQQMLIIGSSLLGYPTCLCIGEDRFGHVFYYDFEERIDWSQAEFEGMFPNLVEDIRNFIDDRDAGSLPQKPPGYENFYHAADSFSEFLTKLERETYEEQ